MTTKRAAAGLKEGCSAKDEARWLGWSGDKNSPHGSLPGREGWDRRYGIPITTRSLLCPIFVCSSNQLFFLPLCCNPNVADDLESGGPARRGSPACSRGDMRHAACLTHYRHPSRPFNSGLVDEGNPRQDRHTSPGHCHVAMVVSSTESTTYMETLTVTWTAS